MRCPHCNKIDHNPYEGTASRNAESYGDGSFVFRCTHCKKKYSCYFDVVITQRKPTKEPSNADLSFGG